MADSLYQQLKKIDSFRAGCERLEIYHDIYKPHFEPLIEKRVQQIIERFTQNPTFENARTGNQSLENTLAELVSEPIGIWDYVLHFPKVRMHNQRLKQIGALIPDNSLLSKQGFRAPEYLAGLFARAKYLDRKIRQVYN
jgi:hypothetical protein